MQIADFLQGMLAPLYALCEKVSPTENVVQLTILIIFTIGIFGVIIKNLIFWR